MTLALTELARTTFPTRGRVLLRVKGTGFVVPVPGIVAGRTPRALPTMRAWFGSIEAKRVRVLSPELAYVDVPPAGPGDLTFRLDTVMPDGTSVESVTWDTPLRFLRPDLTKASTLGRVTRTLIRWLKREVLEETALTTHTEYDDTPEGMGAIANVVDLAKLPALIVAGPKLERNGLYTTNVRKQVADPASGVVLLERPKRTVDLTFEIMGVTDSTAELLNLMQEVADFGERNTQLTMLADEADPTKGLLSFDMMTTQDPQAASRPNESNVRQFTYSIVVKGVELTTEDMATDILFPVREATIDPLNAIPGTAAGGDILVGDGTTDPETGGPLPWPIYFAPGGLFQLDDEG